MTLLITFRRLELGTQRSPRWQQYLGIHLAKWAMAKIIIYSTKKVRGKYAGKRRIEGSRNEDWEGGEKDLAALGLFLNLSLSLAWLERERERVSEEDGARRIPHLLRQQIGRSEETDRFSYISSFGDKYVRALSLSQLYAASPAFLHRLFLLQFFSPFTIKL